MLHEICGSLCYGKESNTLMVTRIICFILGMTIAPFIGLVYILSFVTQHPPVFYVSRRVGSKGRCFPIYKFRTMSQAGSDSSGSRLTNGPSDVRITPLGRILRETKVDELPQLLNIIRGDMAIFGWRPEDPGILEKIEVARYQKLFDYKPGLVSPGSLLNFLVEKEFNARDSSMLESYYIHNFISLKLSLELDYCTNSSFARTIGLVTATVMAVFRLNSLSYRTLCAGNYSALNKYLTLRSLQIKIRKDFQSV